MTEQFNGQSPYERQEHEPSNHAKRVDNFIWNPTTLQWEKMNQAGALNYDTKIENPSTGVYYIGKAAIGSATSASVWQIKKLDTNTLAMDKTWAGGTDAFTKVWDNRAGYTYS